MKKFLGSKKILVLIITIIVVLVSVVGFLVYKHFNKTYNVITRLDGLIINSLKVKENEIASVPTSVTKNDYMFGFLIYEDKIFYSQTPITKDIELHAYMFKYDEPFATVNFYLYDGKGVEHAIIAKKDNLILPMDPIKEGYKFIGWFNTKGKQVYGGEEIKTDIVNIFAKYEKIDNKTK